MNYDAIALSLSSHFLKKMVKKWVSLCRFIQKSEPLNNAINNGIFNMENVKKIPLFFFPNIFYKWWSFSPLGVGHKHRTQNLIFSIRICTNIRNMSPTRRKNRVGHGLLKTAAINQ